MNNTIKTDKIIIKGCRQHNLKNFDLELPRNKLIVITGLSGSGKSSLAFDTLYAEGQRRYVESLSTYARQFLERMEKPDVDLIEGLSPAIAIEQKTSSHNPRSTVGTVTEIYDFIRLLFARAGIPFCYKCGSPVLSRTIDEIVDQIMGLAEKSKIIILSPIVKNQKGSHEGIIKKLRKDGFSRIKIDGKIQDIDAPCRINKNQEHTIDVIVDRLIIKPGINKRLADSLELAFAQSRGQVEVDIAGNNSFLFNEIPSCSNCNITYGSFTPASFSFNSPHGACLECDGLGIKTEFDPDLIVPNPDLSLRDGAVAVWANRNSVHFYELLDALTGHYGAEIHTPFKNLDEGFKQVLFYGSGDEEISFYFEKENRRLTYKKTFEGIIPKLKRRYSEASSSRAKEEIAQYMNSRACPACKGARLNPVSRSVKVGDMGISEITGLSITETCNYFQNLKNVLKGRQEVIAGRIIKEILERLEFLKNVGLGYLTLDRSSNTLSGGENQRIRLATQIGSKLTGVLYVLDEPSIGLHQRDNQQLLSTLIHMRDLGNTVLVVEHDEESILAADYVVDMGPGAGINGGEVVFAGTPGDMINDRNSLTGQYLSGRKSIDIPLRRKIDWEKKISIKGASANNLKNIDVVFPLGCLVCVTGVSGSGKSSLVIETLYRALVQKLYRTRISAGPYEQITGIEEIDKVVNIDQSPIGRTPRSNPGTYTGIFSHIRDLLSKVPESRIRGYKPGRFSFNVKGGRCEACQGDGIVKIEMHFLPDIYVACDICQGKRYNRETLEIRYKGKNIVEILDMTVDQALVFYENIVNIRSKLQTLADVGLGYIRIGQAATTLSGGEAQRVKLAKELSRRATGKTVYILDEPTTGLHFEDIHKLMTVLNRLADKGNTIIIIEHNLDVIKSADHIIDLGPEGGDEGGDIVACGSPEQICEIAKSYTGVFLKKVLTKHK